MGEPADQKTSTTPTIWNSASYTDVVGHHEAVDTTKWGEGLLTDPAASTPFSHLRCAYDTSVTELCSLC